MQYQLLWYRGHDRSIWPLYNAIRIVRSKSWIKASLLITFKWSCDNVIKAWIPVTSSYLSYIPLANVPYKCGISSYNRLLSQEWRLRVCIRHTYTLAMEILANDNNVKHICQHFFYFCQTLITFIKSRIM